MYQFTETVSWRAVDGRTENVVGQIAGIELRRFADRPVRQGALSDQESAGPVGTHQHRPGPG